MTHYRRHDYYSKRLSWIGSQLFRIPYSIFLKMKKYMRDMTHTRHTRDMTFTKLNRKPTIQNSVFQKNKNTFRWELARNPPPRRRRRRTAAQEPMCVANAAWQRARKVRSWGWETVHTHTHTPPHPQNTRKSEYIFWKYKMWDVIWTMHLSWVMSLESCLFDVNSANTSCPNIIDYIQTCTIHYIYICPRILRYRLCRLYFYRFHHSFL